MERIDIPEEASHDMLKEAHSLLLNELVNHVAQNCSNSVKSLVSLTDVLQTEVVEQDLLNDKDGDCLAELATRFHDAQAERNNLCGKKEVDNL
jgi:hypothetical protein